MGSGFKILTHLNGSCIHLKPIGTFNHASAEQLIGLLQKYSRKVSTIIIHTNCIEQNVPFAQKDFRSHLQSVREHPVRFIVTGEHASLFNGYDTR